MRKLFQMIIAFVLGTIAIKADPHAAFNKGQKRISPTESENLRHFQLAVIRSPQMIWMPEYNNLSLAEKTVLQHRQMERIRHGEYPLPVPLTQEQDAQLVKEGHFRPRAP